jgi:serine/threonine protein kinase/tetratricopeptide (TPR) repeat protein
MERAARPGGEGRVRGERVRAADEIVGRCRERLDRGESVDPETVIREHPALARLLRPRLDALLLLLDAGEAPAPAARPSHGGTMLGPYRLVAELGAGGMGTVYDARVERSAAGLETGTRVAVKVIHPELFPRRGYAERFRREADLGRRVKQENVVRTLDAGEAVLGGAPARFLVMEFVEGRTLAALAEEHGRVPEALCRHIGLEVAKALAAIHSAGAVHRDVKPDNILITREHAVKLMDFGVARLRDELARVSRAGTFVGSVRYGAPEQFSAPDAIDGRADLHALGLLLYELATGEHPFDAAEFGAVVRSVLETVPRRAGAVNPQVSPFFEELVAQLLEKDPARRVQSAEEAASILAEGETSAWWAQRAASLRRETRRPLRRVRVERETGLYGRDGELARLRSLYEQASAGDGQVVLIEGEAGIGKSRLVDEFVEALWSAREDADFLCGSWPPGGAATASGAFTSAYREHVGDDEDAIREVLPQTPLLVPAFAALLRGDVAPGDAEKLTKDSLQTVFVHATRSLAARRTTIVFIDDLHFAPEEGRALFASLALAVPGHRILLLGGARPTLDAKWAASLGGLPHLTRLPLARLGAKDLVALLVDALRSPHLAEDLAGRIATKSDGNPFFVFEILRTLRDGMFLTKTADGTWITTTQIREIDVPPSVVEVIQARIADLSREDRELLDVAACVGFEFDAALVGDVLSVAPIPLLQRLGAIEKRHRLVRSVGRRFAFDHHQVQEVFYAGVSGPLREEYHAAIGAAMETRSGAASNEPKDLQGALCVELAEHFLRGAKGERAMRYLGAALEHLERNYLHDAGVRLADRALSVSGLLASELRFEVLLRKAGHLDVLGRRDAERSALDEMLALADAEGDPARRARAREFVGWHFTRVSRYAEAQSFLGEALEIARGAEERRIEAAATGSLANVCFYIGRYGQAQVLYQRKLALAREIGDRRGEAAATGGLGVAFYALGRFAEAQAQDERHLALARELGDRLGEANATGNLGIVLDELGRCVEAQAQYERWLALAREIGDRQGEANATGNLGIVLRSLGRFAEALAQDERYIALAREIGDRQGEATALGNLGVLCLDLGDWGRAGRCLDESLALCREIGARDPEGAAVSGLASAADEEGHDATALRLAEESLALCREIGHGGGIVESLLQVGDLRRRSRDLHGARRALEEAIALSRMQGRLAVVALGLGMRACMPDGDANSAIQAYANAGSSADTVHVRHLLWLSTHDPAHLAEAKRHLDHLVAHAPPEYRESMVANVRLHREIAEAAREHLGA